MSRNALALRAWFRFLGSMNLAITLLIGVAVASVVGTVLQQNQPFNGYIIKFGPFWHQVFRSLNLYDIYASSLFLAILTFLVVSTSICVSRHAPGVLRSMRQYQERVHEQSLARLPDQASWQTTMSREHTATQARAVLSELGFSTRQHEEPGRVVVAGMRGRWNRLGYLLTHMAIVIICLGGLMDGSLLLKLKQQLGSLRIETRDVPVSEIPPDSFLPADNPSFRASLSLPEGATAAVAFIPVADGYVVQRLPFSIELIDFRIERYASGQPKSFESDLVVRDGDNELKQTIAVNHPLRYRGFTVYQASFADGGSRLSLHAAALLDPAASRDLEVRVNDNVTLAGLGEPLRLEVTDFRRFNVNPAPAQEKSGAKFHDAGPSFHFKLRRADGTALEYESYMLPSVVDGRLYFLSGVRNAPSEPFRYLHIPADDDDSTARFFRFLTALGDDAVLDAVAGEVTGASSSAQPRLGGELSQALKNLARLFREGGFEAVQEFVARAVPAADQEAALQAYVKLTAGLLQFAYNKALQAEGITPRDMGSEEQRFFDDAVAAVSALGAYGAPVFLELRDFEHRQASGLQIAKTPGKPLVYLGFLLLTSGVFLLFFVPFQRVWVQCRGSGGGTRLLLAFRPFKHKPVSTTEFRTLCEAMDRRF